MARIYLARQVGIVVTASREAHGLTQAQVANAAGVSRQLVNRLEMGSATGIALNKLLAILEAVDCALDVYSLDTGEEHAVSFEPTSLSTTLQAFNPAEEYPFDESLFEANGEVCR